MAESEDQLVARYIGGLRIQFQDSLNLYDPTFVSEAHQRALQLERQLNRNDGMQGGGCTSSMTQDHNMILQISLDKTAEKPPANYTTFVSTSGVATRFFKCGEQ